MFRAKFLECYDFDQPDFQVYSTMETILLNAVRGQDFDGQLNQTLNGIETFVSVYKEDIDIWRIQKHGLSY